MTQQSEPITKNEPPTPSLKYNPWLSIWLKPGDTMKYLLDFDSDIKSNNEKYFIIAVFQMMALLAKHQKDSISLPEGLLLFTYIALITLIVISFGIQLSYGLCKLFKCAVNKEHLAQTFVWGFIVSAIPDVIFAILGKLFGQEALIVNILLLGTFLWVTYMLIKMFRVTVQSKILAVLLVITLSFMSEITITVINTLRFMKVI